MSVAATIVPAAKSVLRNTGTDECIDPPVVAIQADMAVNDLEEMELADVLRYDSAKVLINITWFVALNIGGGYKTYLLYHPIRRTA